MHTYEDKYMFRLGVSERYDSVQGTTGDPPLDGIYCLQRILCVPRVSVDLQSWRISSLVLSAPLAQLCDNVKWAKLYVNKVLLCQYI